MSDLIDRQAILKHIEKIRQDALMMDDTHRASIVMKGMNLCEEAVRNQPSEQPKHGYWIESHEHIYMGNGVKEWTNWYCSECDAPNDKPTDFCPSCGADMRGGEHE